MDVIAPSRLRGRSRLDKVGSKCHCPPASAPRIDRSDDRHPMNPKEPSRIAPDALTAAQAKAELERLADEIAAHDQRYYQEDAPTVSDADYDALRQRNVAIEARFPELVRAEFAQPPGRRRAGAKVRQGPPRGADALARQRLRRRGGRRLRRPGAALPRPAGDAPLAFTAEPKIDGLSLLAALRGAACWCRPRRAATAEGEDVTANVRTIGDIPERLPASASPTSFEVRGEVYMAHADFAALNARQEAAGQAGLRQSAQRRRRLAAPDRPDDHRERGRCASSPMPGARSASCRPRPSPACSRRFGGWGFPTNPLMRCADGRGGCSRVYREIETTRAELGYDIDGVVYKVDRLDLQERLGFVSRSAALGDRAQVPGRAGATRCSTPSTSRSAAPAR